MGLGTRRAYASALWLLTLLFALRVSGQAIQRWAPQPFLPDFGSFQGSGLHYGVLLPMQLVILAAMGFFAWRVQAGALAPSPRAGRILAWIGWIYLLGSVARIIVGLAVPAAPAWFSTWIPAVYHVVLAAYVLTLAYYHRIP